MFAVLSKGARASRIPLTNRSVRPCLYFTLYTNRTPLIRQIRFAHTFLDFPSGTCNSVKLKLLFPRAAMSQLVPYLNFGLELSQGFDNNDFNIYYNNDTIANNDKMFIALEGLNSGVPTRTTPTLTPTTLRNIEQTFIELQSKPQSHENEAGFVPPLVHSIGNNQYISASEASIYTTVSNNTSKSSTIWHSNLSQSSSDSNTTSPSPADLQKNMLQYDTPTPTRRNMGGRKPNKDTNISPEEEERRKVRRERNKAAAARCRKRRVDHTNQLLEETAELEAKKRDLQLELQELQVLKEELDFVLETHKPKCRLLSLGDTRPITPPDVKPYLMNPTFLESLEDRIKVESDHLSDVTDDDIFCSPSPAKRIMLSSTIPISKPNRPSSLNVAVSSVPYGNTTNKNFAELPGIAITTPSSGLQFNFDSLMGGGTGLTPVSMPLTANCSTQQRTPVSLSNDLGSPESCIPPKLVSL